MRGRPNTGLTKLLKLKIHPDIYHFLQEVARKKNISTAEIARRIIYEAVMRVSFPEDAKKIKEAT